jgi:hypothetical protein
MTFIVTSDYELQRVAPPALPTASNEYSKLYQDQLNNALRLYFNRLTGVLGQLMASSDLFPVPLPVSIGGTNVDAFGRLRVSQPYTLFDSQNRYAKDAQFSESLTSGGSATYLPNEATVRLGVTTSSTSKAVRQSFRVFPYQPGKGLLVLATFVMADAQENVRQRVGYFNENNGVFFQKNNATNSFVLRTSTSGSPSDARTVNQADWNGDKLDGTGTSGFTLNTSKAQILWMDFEWLGVGSVRCGFIINGQYIVCHTFNNANDQDKVYMTTAILPVRYELENIGTVFSSSNLRQICSSVISEGGYEQTSIDHVARRTTVLGTIGGTFLPLVSIRLASTALGAVVLPNRVQVLPTTSQNYEVALIKNPTLTGASWAAVSTDANVEFDVAATATTGGSIVQTDYVTASGSSGISNTSLPNAYNFDLQLGVSIAGTSDIYTVAIRTVSGATTGDAVGSLSFYDLTI